MGYHPCSIAFKLAADPAVGQCQAEFDSGGRLKGYRRRPKVPSEWTETIRRVQKAEGSLTGDTDGWSRYGVRLSDPVVLWECHRSTDKSQILG